MRLVSVLGDSISTYDGYNPKGYSVYYDSELQRQNDMSSVYDTWWAKVNKALQAFLCVNNSYSGSKVSGKDFPAGCCEERLNYLRTKEFDPDFILVYMGFNDFGYGVDLKTFESCYDYILETLRLHYSRTKIICGTLMRTRIKSNNEWIFPECHLGIEFEKYNDIIRISTRRNDCYLVDIGRDKSEYETKDGSHPTISGHTTIAKAWIDGLGEIGLLEPSVESCIKMYYANNYDDLSLYMVFEALSRERVLVPLHENGNPLGLSLDNQLIIPLFTTLNETDSGIRSKLQAVFLKDIIQILFALNMNIVINPFSAPDKAFVIPYSLIEKMLLPLI